jgi:hypothetical protein
MAYIIVSAEADDSQREAEAGQAYYGQPPAHQQPSLAPVSTVSHSLQPANTSLRSGVGDNKESYIASEWNDYTYDGPDRLANKGTNLKGSEHNIDPIGRSEVQNVGPKRENFDYNHSQPNVPKPTSYNESTSIYTETKYKQESISTLTKNTYGQSDYLANSHQIPKPPVSAPYPTPASVPSANQSQTTTPFGVKPSLPVASSPYSQSIPTKDISTYGTQQVNSSYQTSQASKSYEVNSLAKQTPTFESNVGNNLIYSPKVDASLYAPKIDSSLYSATSSNAQYGAYGGSHANANVTAPVGNKKRNAFGLNVSDEFTPPETIKRMAEPFKSNVVTIVSRARQFRSSLSGGIK